MRKQDLRVVKTKAAIKESFLEHLKRKQLSEITVKDITESAMCNRNTFYLHYEDKYDLIKKICFEALEKLSKELDKVKLRGYRTSEDRYNDISMICLDCIESDYDFYMVMLGKNRYPSFLDAYRKTITEYIYKALPDSKRESLSKKLELEYSSNGLIGILRFWVINFDEYSKEAIFDASRELIWYIGEMIYK